MDQKIPQPSEFIQQFLNAGYFSNSNQAPISLQSENNNFLSQPPEIFPLNNNTQKNMENIYTEMLSQKNIFETVSSGKINDPLQADISNLFSPSSPSKTAQEAIQGIADIKARGDQIDAINSSESGSAMTINGEGFGGGNGTNVTNVTNITQVTTDYMLKLKNDFLRLPAWRDMMG